MRHASLFTGIGGFDLASAWMGWENVFQCEISEWCNTILEFYFPNTTRYANIKETDFTKWGGKIDILTGGFPCQPFSVAGQRKGQEDDRYLWPEMLRAIREIRPTWVVGENVGGILSMVQPGSESIVAFQKSLFNEIDKETLLEQEYVVGTVCNDLEQEGYSVQPVVIPACAVGAPHRRDRIWFIANRSDAGFESLQQGRKDCIYGFEAFTNANCYDAGGLGYEEAGRKERKGKATEGQREWLRCNAERTGAKGVVAHAYGERCNNGGDNREERYVYSNQKRDTPEDKSERAERKCRIGEDGSIITDPKCFGSDQIRKNLQSGQSDGARAYSDGGKRNATNPDYLDGDLSGLYASEIPQFETSRIRIDTLTNNERCTKQYFVPESEKQGFGGRTCNATRCDWRNFPSQSPVCCRDDGFSNRLDTTAVFKGQRTNKRSDVSTVWRTESIKAFGNAIVPEVAFEVFKAISIANDLPDINID